MKKYKIVLFAIVGFFSLIAVGLLSSRLLAQPSRVSVRDLAESSKISKDNGDLVTLARERGGVRVIVELNPGFAISDQKGLVSLNASQKSKLNVAKDQVLSRIDRVRDVAVKRMNDLPYVAMRVSATELEKLQKDPQVAQIYQDVPVPPTLTSSIPVIDADLAWDQGFTGSGWTVAILDTGVDKTHEFLTGKVVSEACYSTIDAGEGSSSVCPNGLETQITTGAGVNCSSAVDGCDHGTHVAGIAAGKGDTFSGVAKDADIIAIQVFSRFDSVGYCGSASPCVLSWTSDQILALGRVNTLSATYDIASANMSLGGGEYTDYCDGEAQKASIDTLRANDIATVIAAGNDYYWAGIGSPACISSAIGVGASTDADAFALYSNIADILDVVAPGSSINSSVPGDAYESWDGTSMATPHVTGAWAVMKSKRASATVTEIESALESTGTTITETWFSVPISLPRIDLDDALDELTADVCLVPGAGDWTVSDNCTLELSDTAFANVTVESDVTLIIPSSVILDMDLDTYQLVVENGGKVFVENGGRIN